MAGWPRLGSLLPYTLSYYSYSAIVSINLLHQVSIGFPLLWVIYLDVLTLDILLNVFLAIAVDNLGDAEDVEKEEEAEEEVGI